MKLIDAGEQQHPLAVGNQCLVKVKINLSFCFKVRGQSSAWRCLLHYKNPHAIYSAFLQALYKQYQQFKEREIPLKENEKTKIQNFYKMLEVNKTEE